MSSKYIPCNLIELLLKSSVGVIYLITVSNTLNYQPFYLGSYILTVSSAAYNRRMYGTSVTAASAAAATAAAGDDDDDDDEDNEEDDLLLGKAGICREYP